MGLIKNIRNKIKARAEPDYKKDNQVLRFILKMTNRYS